MLWRGQRENEHLARRQTEGMRFATTHPHLSARTRGSRSRIFLTELLILIDRMVRAATALIVLFSVLSAPIAPAVCIPCCNRPAPHELPLDHDKAPAQPGPHVHHMNHVHMVTQDPDGNVGVQKCDHQLQASRLSCRTTVCRSAEPVQASASVPTHPLQGLIATTMGGAVTISGSLSPPGACRITVPSFPTAAAPLRI
jgi:hypothetical protein